MRFQIRGLFRGAANIDDGVSYCQVADGALNEMHDILQRMNELSVQAANGLNSKSDRLLFNRANLYYIASKSNILRKKPLRINEFKFQCTSNFVPKDYLKSPLSRYPIIAQS